MRKFKCEICVNTDNGRCELFLTKARELNVIERLLSRNEECNIENVDYFCPDVSIICKHGLISKLTSGASNSNALQPITYDEDEAPPCFV